MTGKTVWQSAELSDEAGLLVRHRRRRAGRAYRDDADGRGRRRRARDGWKAAVAVCATSANRTANIATPVYSDSRVFYTSGYGTGGALLTLRAIGRRRQRDARSTSRATCRITTAAWCSSTVTSTVTATASSTCLEFATGKMMWRDRSVGKGSLSYADGTSLHSERRQRRRVGRSHTVCVSREGPLRDPAIRACPAGRIRWLPAGRLFIRNQGTLTAYDIRSK